RGGERGLRTASAGRLARGVPPPTCTDRPNPRRLARLSRNPWPPSIDTIYADEAGLPQCRLQRYGRKSSPAVALA
ncbi:MAG: hypothetical protein AAB403_09820, partial [Planctomycetota bacterium]